MSFINDWANGECNKGKHALTEGKIAERAVADHFKQLGHRVVHVSENEEQYNCGYDMTINGNKTEIKSNDYIDDNGHMVVEVTDKTSNERPAKWKAAADRYIFVERQSGEAHVYDAKILAKILDDNEKIPKWNRYERLKEGYYSGARCVHLPVNNKAKITETKL
jgi:hypothetical protein